MQPVLSHLMQQPFHMVSQAGSPCFPSSWTRSCAQASSPDPQMWYQSRRPAQRDPDHLACKGRLVSCTHLHIKQVRGLNGMDPSEPWPCGKRFSSVQAAASCYLVLEHASSRGGIRAHISCCLCLCMPLRTQGGIGLAKRTQK